MSSLFNCAISAVVGGIAAVATVWYLAPNTNGSSNASAPAVDGAHLQELVVDSLVVRDSVSLVDPETGESTLEMRDGSIVAQNSVCAEQLGAYRILGQKLQATPEDPLDSKSPVFGELAVNEDGGAYLAILSPRESHSVTIGFDKNEKGCVVSQNNDDMSMVAQAIFLKPIAPEEKVQEKKIEETAVAAAQERPVVESASLSNEETIRR